VQPKLNLDNLNLYHQKVEQIQWILRKESMFVMFKISKSAETCFQLFIYIILEPDGFLLNGQPSQLIIFFIDLHILNLLTIFIVVN
jgi:hypothetical protein